MRSPSNWTRFPGLWRRSNKFQLIVNFSKEFQLKVSDALVSCTLSRMHRKPLIWKVFSAFIRTPIKNSKKKIKHSEELNLVSNISLFLSIKAFSSQLFLSLKQFKTNKRHKHFDFVKLIFIWNRLPKTKICTQSRFNVYHAFIFSYRILPKELKRKKRIRIEKTWWDCKKLPNNNSRAIQNLFLKNNNHPAMLFLLFRIKRRILKCIIYYLNLKLNSKIK